jgi:hypothetical protein
VWRYREMSRREKRRLGAVFVLTSSVAGFPLSIFTLVGDKGVSDHPVVWVLLGGATLGTLIGFAMVLVHVRPSRTVMQIVEDRLKDERQRWAQELAALRASDAQQMERWQEEAVDTIYSVVMDQVEKGIISCAKCTESGAAHYEGHRDGLPANEPQPVEGTSKPCECDGPASIRVLYFPPRFQSKRTAS